MNKLDDSINLQSKCLVYHNYDEGGGYVGNLWVKNLFPDTTDILIKEASLKEYGRIFKLISHKYDVVILNGLLAFPLSFLLNQKIVVINHNVESYIFTNRVKKLLVNILQKYSNRKAYERFFFNANDANYLGVKSFSTIPPVWDKINLSKQVIAGYNDYEYVIPSNLAYAPNIEGLLFFYSEYRKYLKDDRILITSPNKLNNGQLETHIMAWNDTVVTLSKGDYLSLISYKKVLLPIYRGSGIQIKALEALQYNKTAVFASDFIRNSDSRFQIFQNLDEVRDSDK